MKKKSLWSLHQTRKALNWEVCKLLQANIAMVHLQKAPNECMRIIIKNQIHFQHARAKKNAAEKSEFENFDTKSDEQT